MRQTTRLALFSLLVASSIIAPVSAVTFHGTVQEGNWAKYKITARLSLNAPPVFQASVTFDLTFNLTIASVIGDNISLLVHQFEGSLKNTLETFGLNISNETVLIPFNLFIIPTDLLANETWQFDNVSVPTSVEKETNPQVFWRGLSVRVVDLLAIMGSEGEILPNMTAHAKFDNQSGWLYNVVFGGAFEIPEVGSISLSIVLEMIDASMMIKDHINSQKDPLEEFGYVITSLFYNPRSLLIIVLVSMAIFYSIVMVKRRRPNLSMFKV